MEIAIARAARSRAAKWEARSLPLLMKNLFGDHGMHTLVPIHQLRDAEIHRHAGQHVGVLAAHMFLGSQEIDSFADGESRGLAQVFIQAHAAVVRGWLDRKSVV